MKAIIPIQVLVAFITGLASLFILYRILNSFMRKRFGIQEANNAFAIFQAGILVSGSLILSSVMNAAMNAIHYLNQGDIDTSKLMMSVTYVLVFMGIGLVCSLLLILSGMYAFFQMTQINEWKEIKNDNIPTAVISTALILGLSMIMDDYVGHLCEALIPYPEVMQIR